MRKLLIFLLIPFLLFAVTVNDLVDDNDMITHNECAVIAGGIIEDCSDYDGDADWMDCNDNDNLDFTNADFTIQVWVNADVLTGSNQFFVMKKGDATDALMNYGLKSAPARKIVLNIGSVGYNSQKLITTGSWYHIVCVFDYNPGGNNTAHFYVNNNKASIVGSANPTANDYDLVIGKHMSVGVLSDYEWNGQLDEIGIWNRTLSDAEAASLYNGGSGLAYSSFTAGLLNGLVSYWSHDDGAPAEAGQIIQTKISWIRRTLEPPPIGPLGPGDSTDWKLPQTGTNVDRDGKEIWHVPTNIYACDEAPTTAEISASDYSDWLRATNFGFTTEDIPLNVTIVGIKVKIRQMGDLGGSIKDDALYLRKTSGQVGDNGASSVYWATSWEYKTRGGSSDNWNANLIPSDIHNSDFGVDLSAYNVYGDELDATVDCIQIRVFYEY